MLAQPITAKETHLPVPGAMGLVTHWKGTGVRLLGEHVNQAFYKL